MKLITVHAFANICDESPEAIFTVAAPDEDEAVKLATAAKAGVFYDCFLTETYAEHTAYPNPEIIAFERVYRGSRGQDANRFRPSEIAADRHADGDPE